MRKLFRGGGLFEIYKENAEKHIGRPMKVVYIAQADHLANSLGCKWQYKYARGISRQFDNNKLLSIIGNMEFRDFKTGANQCLDAYFEQYMQGKVTIAENPRLDGCVDRVTKEWTNITEYSTFKRKLRYILSRMGIV